MVRALIDDVRHAWATIPRPGRTLLVLVTAGLVAVAALAVLVAKLVDDVMGADGLTDTDPRITEWVVAHRGGRLTAIARAVTRLGDPLWVAVAVLIAAGALWLLGRPRLGAFVVVSSAGAALVTTTGKLVVGRPRPPVGIRLVHATGAAFPSGHATQSVACWAAIAAAVVLASRHRPVRTAAAVLGGLFAAAIGASRVYLGVHWASDVVCGWAIASLWLATLLLIGWAGPRVVRGGRSMLRGWLTAMGGDGSANLGDR